MPTEVREIGARITRLFQNWLDGYLYDNQVGVSNQENRIVVESVYYPVIGSLDLRVYQPRSNTFYEVQCGKYNFEICLSLPTKNLRLIENYEIKTQWFKIEIISDVVGHQGPPNGRSAASV